MSRRLLAAAIAATTLAAGALLGAAPAFATNSGENCNYHYGPYDPGASGAGNMCYFYTRDEAGAEEGLEGNDPNFTENNALYFNYANYGGAYDGISATDGLGKGVWNDAGSGYNFINNCSVTVYSGTDYSGPYSVKFPAISGLPNLGSVTNLDLSQKACT
ncbi:MAG TPA: hypothetical protein VMA72_21120 [Streptosporangiaceae bacterium]|nr:hypothetical protein [Streptosporangiaceae bacterium]